MKIGIVGGGFVGRAVARGFMEHAEVRVFDIDPTRATHSWDDTLSCDFVFLCLPTEHNDDRDDPYNMGPMNQFFQDYIEWADKRPDDGAFDPVLVIKSTVPVGFTAEKAELLGYRARLVHNPEFLTARCSIVDYQTPSRHIIGRTKEDMNGWLRLSTLLLARFPGVPRIVISSRESELAKLSCNAFFATKVAFFNMVYRACEEHGLDFEHVRAAVLSDGRIAHAHTAVPGPDGGLGFGGACLPKDLWAFASMLPSLDQHIPVSIHQWNKIIREKGMS